MEREETSPRLRGAIFFVSSTRDAQQRRLCYAGERLLLTPRGALFSPPITPPAQAAASWLLECGDVGAAQRAWEATQAAAAAEREREAQEREANRKKIVERFQLEAVPGGEGKGGKGGRDPRALAAWQPGAKEAAAGAGKVRYREGMAVASKGEKFIVEQVRGWVGGERGTAPLGESGTGRQGSLGLPARLATTGTHQYTDGWPGDTVSGCRSERSGTAAALEKSIPKAREARALCRIPFVQGVLRESER